MVYVKARSCFICCITKIEVMSNLVPGCCTLPQVFTCGTGNRTLRHGFCGGWLWSFQRVSFTGYTPKPAGCNGKEYGKPFDLDVIWMYPIFNPAWMSTLSLESFTVGGWPPRVFDSDDKQEERQKTLIQCKLLELSIPQQNGAFCQSEWEVRTFLHWCIADLEKNIWWILGRCLLWTWGARGS